MARPKGVVQKRDESKYWLPDGIAVQLNPPKDFRKDTKLIFIDNIYGEFKSTFKAIQDANASTHPKAVIDRRAKTNIKIYGSSSPISNKEVRKKFQETLMKNHGVTNPYYIPNAEEKRKKTNLDRYGSENVMLSEIIREKVKATTIKNFGVDNPMKSDKVKERLKENNLKKYNVANPMLLPEIKQKAADKLFESFREKGNKSKEELEVRQFIESLGFETTTGKVNNQQIDIEVIGANIGIEYNGLKWHNEEALISNGKKKPRRYHLDKTLEYQRQGKRLIHIFSNEWLESKEQVKSFLRSALGKNEIIIYARNTELRNVPKEEAREFLNKYHILKAPPVIKYAIGLYKDGELLCMVTLAPHHRKGSELTLNRFIGKENVTVTGGLSKLTKYILNNYGEVTTLVDRCISEGDNWEKCGWKKEHVSRPDYFYYNPKTHKVIGKQSRQKAKINTPPGMTEAEHAKLDGLVRVWDCGKIRFRLK